MMYNDFFIYLKQRGVILINEDNIRAMQDKEFEVMHRLVMKEYLRRLR